MANTTNSSVREPTHRLPTTAVPSHYLLYVDASQLEQFLFHGTVDIDIQINQAINEIVLNSVDLNITKIEYQDNHLTSPLVGTAEFDEEYEQATIRFTQSIEPGNGRLHIEFNGTIEDELHGFYRTKDDGKIGACTQFEPDYARRAFPCFDEPSFKAKFTITIRSPSHLTTLSNMV
jgi:puromycin-sensitive aminopeptidase